MPRGLHRMAYWEWGDAANPRVLVCVHGLSRQGRDFDTLAQAPVRPTTASSAPTWSAAAAPTGSPIRPGYQIPAYVADMVTLLARLNAAGAALGRHVDGRPDRHGPGVAAGFADPAPGAQRRRPGDQAEVARSASAPTSGVPMRWDSLDEAADYLLSHLAGLRPAHARAVARADAADARAGRRAGFKPHYDPAIAVPFRAITPEQAAAGEAMLWRGYDAIRCPTLLLRGAESDLLTRETARGDDAARPEGDAARVRRRRPCADAGAARPGRGRAGVPAVAMSLT